MKILEIFGEPISYGGQESFVMNMITHMNLSGLKIDLLTPYYCENENYKKTVSDLGGNIYSLNVDFNPEKSRRSIIDPLRKFLSENKYDVAHIHSGSMWVLAFSAKVAKMSGVKKVIVHSHSSVEKINFKNIILRNILGIYMKKYVDVYCACSQIAGDAKFRKNISKNNLLILKNGIDLKKYKFNSEKRNAVRKQLNIKEKAFVIGHVGRFSYEKNHDFLIEIFIKLIQKEPDSVLMLVGDGELKGEIKQKVNNSGLQNKVIFVGNVDNVNDYLQAMDVFALPSYFEGLPIVGVEAQGAGLRLLTTKNVSRELNISGRVKFLDLNIGAEKWADEILKLKNDIRYDDSEKIRKAGYSIETTADLVRKLYIK